MDYNIEETQIENKTSKLILRKHTFKLRYQNYYSENSYWNLEI